MRPPRTWAWLRWVAAGQQDEWIDRLEQGGCTTWTLSERANRKRRLLAVYSASRVEVARLHAKFGGRLRAISKSEWLPSRPARALRMASKFEVVEGRTLRSKKAVIPQLIIPHGMAFGSGEHATTAMLLRALAAESVLGRVLDLGTGSGILALAARLLGARKIVATDFDPDAIRIARANELLNFPGSLIRWQQGDVLGARRSTARYDLVIANLYSGLLIAAARNICASLATPGRLWQSGILHTQKDEVIAAYSEQKLKLTRCARRGKWVMLQWQRPARSAAR